MKKWMIPGMLLAALLCAAPSTTLAASQENPVVAQAVAKININLASLQELQSLPGVGKVTAERIVQYREQKGAFETTEQLMKVKGIGKKNFQKIKDLITVE